MTGTSDACGPCLVLGYDRTDSARWAGRWAAKELPANGKLVIVHACRPLHSPPSQLSSARERRQVGRAMIDELLLEGEDSLQDIDVKAEISDEDPVAALLDAARRHRAHGIVVGCERRSRLHWALGTVTSELLQSSPVPVTLGPLAAVTPTAPSTRSGEAD